MINNEFCFLMKFLRERSGLSARQLSINAGLSTSYVSKVESGAVLPTIESFARLVSNLDITDKEIAYLIKMLVKNK